MNIWTVPALWNTDGKICSARMGMSRELEIARNRDENEICEMGVLWV